MKRWIKRALEATGIRQSSWERWQAADDLEAVPVPDPRDVSGTVRIWSSEPSGELDGGATMRTTWVPGPAYDGMKNNDLRGYLDGRFQYGWNQVSQSHVRVGRLPGWVAYGEHELFRVLHRWDGVELPERARVLGATLTLGVEAGPPVPLRLHLYRVRRDWNPGGGGRLCDNVSPPADDEVWWNEAAHGSASWGLPGVGHAAGASPEADTDAEPLAEARFTPGDEALTFASPEFAAYCQEAIGAQEPLRLLIKLSDVQEDVPGALLTLYGADQGDDRTLDRRPHLTLDWDAPGQLLASRPLRLEHGRTVELAPVAVPSGGWVFLEFVPDVGSGPLCMELRGEDGAWGLIEHPVRYAGPALTARARALINPVVWGRSFQARFRDTWVRSAPAEQQRVPFRFTSPTGVEHEVLAAFEGDATWRASFTPDEVGPWRYMWTHELAETPYESSEGAFDVVVEDRTQAMEALRALSRRAQELPVRSRPVGGRRLLVAFSRLERAIMALETPESWRSPGFAPVAELMDATRKSLWGQTVPDELPMEPCPPPEWAEGPVSTTTKPAAPPTEDS